MQCSVDIPLQNLFNTFNANSNLRTVIPKLYFHVYVDETSTIPETFEPWLIRAVTLSSDRLDEFSDKTKEKVNRLSLRGHTIRTATRMWPNVKQLELDSCRVDLTKFPKLEALELVNCKRPITIPSTVNHLTVTGELADLQIPSSIADVTIVRPTGILILLDQFSAIPKCKYMHVLVPVMFPIQDTVTIVNCARFIPGDAPTKTLTCDRFPIDTDNEPIGLYELTTLTLTDPFQANYAWLATLPNLKTLTIQGRNDNLERPLSIDLQGFLQLETLTLIDVSVDTLLNMPKLKDIYLTRASVGKWDTPAKVHSDAVSLFP